MLMASFRTDNLYEKFSESEFSSDLSIYARWKTTISHLLWICINVMKLDKKGNGDVLKEIALQNYI